MNLMSEKAFFLNREIAKNNIKKIVLISKYNILALIIIFGLNILNYSITNREAKLYLIYPLIIIALFNYAFIFAIRKYRFNFTLRTINIIDNIVFGYIVFSMSCSAFIIIINDNFINNSLYFSLLVFALSSFFVIKSYYIVLPVLSSGCMIIYSLYLKNAPLEDMTMFIAYTISLAVVSWLLSKAHYQTFLYNNKIKADLIEENLYRKKISKDLREANRKLMIQNCVDPLTSLQNRMSFNEYFEKSAKEAEKAPFYLTVVIIDIDCFKKYNDTYGHMKGDEVISKVGSVIFEVAQKYGVFAARYGGEEFTLLMKNQTKNKIRMIIEEITYHVSLLQIPHKSNEACNYVSLSIGAYTNKIHNIKDANKTLEIADALLYRVKNSGKNKYIYEDYKTFQNTSVILTHNLR